MNFTCENACLDSSSDCYALIGVDALEGFLACNVLNSFLNCGDTCGSAYQDNLSDVSVSNAGISHSLVHRLDGSLYEVFCQLVELSTCQVYVHVKRTVCRY